MIKFAQLVLGGAKQAEAFREAYPKSQNWKPQAVWTGAARAMQNVHVRRLIEEGRALVNAKIIAASVMERQELLGRWSARAQVDRNELCEVRRVACRYCHGTDHLYQRTPAEMRAARAQYDQAVKAVLGSSKHGQQFQIPDFAEEGGVGYDRRKDPHPECPECHGFGDELVILKDTRRLSKAAMDCFEGVDIKNGSIVIKISSRAEDEDRLAKAQGIYGADKGPARPNFNILVQEGGVANIIPDDPAQAAIAYQRLVGRK
jgi:hypothetical protein